MQQKNNYRKKTKPTGKGVAKKGKLMDQNTTGGNKSKTISKGSESKQREHKELNTRKDTETEQYQGKESKGKKKKN